MSLFTTVYNKLYRFFNPHWDLNMAESRRAFGAYLNGGENPRIRMWVDAAPGSGHQSSTIGILRQLANATGNDGFGYSGIIDVYYQRGEDRDRTLPKLHSLLPELRDRNTGDVGLATVNLIEWTNDVAEIVNLGFSGGADDEYIGNKPESPNFARRIGVNWLLRLQPYLWGAPEQIQYLAGPPYVTLTSQRVLGYGSFNQRAYFIRTPIPEPDWEIYDEEWRNKAEIIFGLTVDPIPRVGVVPIYSIRSSGNMELSKPAYERMFEVIASVLASQRSGARPVAGAKSIIVLSCDTFGSREDRTGLEGLIGGAFTIDEDGNKAVLDRGTVPDMRTFQDRRLTAKERAEYQNALKGHVSRSAWLRSIDAADRVEYVWDATPDAVNDHIPWLREQADRVLFVQLGKVPMPLFQWLMQSAEWPSVFEGQSTATVALNIANPYFHVARPGSPVVQYPTTVIGYEAYTGVETQELYIPVVFIPQVPRKIQDAANWLTWPATQWSPVSADNPAERTGEFVRQYNAEDNTGEYHRYFLSIREFYRNVNNDKLRVGAAFMQYILQSQGAVAAGRMRAFAARASALDELLVALNENRDADGLLHVAPGTFSSGGIDSFYTSFLGKDPGLQVGNSTIVPRYEDGLLTAIDVTGTTSFFGLPLTAMIVFTAPEGTVIGNARYAYAQRWSLDEIPWIGFSDPFIEICTIDSEMPPAASIGGTLDGVDVELAFQLPVVEGKWQLAGSFNKPYPSIARFYSFAGGVNLVQALPSPFNGLAGFGLQNLRLVYDSGGREIEYIGFRFATSDGFTLIGTLSITNINVDVTVQRPTARDRSVDWAVRGTFRIGDGDDAAIIAIGASGPELVLTGSLVRGVLTVSGILNAFAPGFSITLPSEPEITAFQTSLTPATGNYSVSCELNIGWPIVVAGTQVFSIDRLGLMAQSTSGMVSASLNGYVTIGSGESAIPLSLVALYSSAEGWTFTVSQSTDDKVSLTALAKQFLPPSWKIDQDYSITGLGLSVRVNDMTWSFTGRTAGAWDVPFLSGLTVSASLTLGYNAGSGASLASLPGIAGTTTALDFVRTGGCDGSGYFARLETEWLWQKVKLKIFFDYCPTKKRFGIVWNSLEGTLVGPEPDGDWVATVKFDSTVTLGSIVETMVSWVTGSTFALEAPWSVLNKVPLSGLALTYTFNRSDPSRNQVGFKVDIGPIELGFARIDSVNIVYNSLAEQKVAITLSGTFPWLIGQDANGDASTLGPWDASQPGSAPAPPGEGNKYLDLRLLTLGQHVTIDGLTTAKTVQKAIERMADMKDPQPGKIPDVKFDPASAWIIGSEFGVLKFGPPESPTPPTGSRGGWIVPPNARPAEPPTTGYVLTMQVVFNDPYLYGLRLALAGDAAKIFKGLDFQIMYRQVSETVGVYQSEITLPDVMRHLSIGAYSITLPVFGIAVYTNGDFQADVGFPWNEDFSRSFTLEGIIYPGIPVLGSAGLYFGKLSSASTDKVPRAINGTFNPVLVFGLGMQIGFGKSLEYGILKAGFSVTVVGILEGVLAKFNRYLTDGGDGNDSQLQGAYYFWLRGTFGIVGRLYGSIDFAIIKADVNVTLKLLLQLTYESYVSMTISVIVSVDVSVSIKIDLGLFSIKISFSFSMRVKETFTIENRGTSPWITSGTTGGAFISATDLRLRDFRLPSSEFVVALGAADRWRRLLRSTSGTTGIRGYLAPALTVAHDERDGTQDPKKQEVCYVFMPLIETVPEIEETVGQLVTASLRADEGDDTSFELLAKMILRWAVAAGQSSDLTPEDVDKLVVKESDLSFILETVLVSTDANPVPIPPEDVDDFLSRQFRLTLSVPPSTGSTSATYFPMPPALQLVVPKYGDSYPGYDYTFETYNKIDDATLVELRKYFDDLAVQVQREMDASLAAKLTGSAPSMGTWVLSDYFLLLTRQMVQAALDSLRDFKFVIRGQSAQAIVDEVNRIGELPPGPDFYTLKKLFAANPTHVLNSGKTLTIGVTWPVASNDSFETIAVNDFESAVSPLDLATSNAANPTILRAGATIHYLDQEYTVVAGNTLIDVAWQFEVEFGNFLSGATDLTTQQTLFVNGALMLVPLVTYQAQTESTFDSIAAMAVYGSAFSATALATQNAGRAILRIGEKVPYPTKSDYTILANDTLADVAAAFEVTLAELFANSKVLGQARLLADVAVIVLPPVAYATAPKDTLQAVATRFAAPFDVLGLQSANGQVENLFADVDADGAPAPFLDVPHLTQYRVAEIIAEAQRSLAIRQLSRLAARYSMHGLRLPTDGITPMAKGIWVEGESPNYALPPKAGLYALTGQEIPLPQFEPASGDFTMKFVRNGGPDWLLFGSGTDELSIKITPESDDATRVAKLREAAQAGPLAIDLDTLGADAMYESRLASYPLTSVIAWQTPSAVTLPYGPPPSAGKVPELRIWKLPDALIHLPDPRTPEKITPRFDVKLATYDEATGATVQTPITSYGWSTMITFTIKRVPPIVTSPATLTTYEIAGASGGDVVLLERIVAEVRGDDLAFQQLILGYAPDTAGAATKGVQTGAPVGITMSIAQVNLSTETRPDGSAASALFDASPRGVINPPSEFVRLLWEASITRAGGFYLYYFDALAGIGLPDRIFNDRNEANVSLIVLWNAGATPAASNRVKDYMNGVVTGDSIDTARSVVFAEAAPLDSPLTAAGNLSLEIIAERTYSNVADLAEANATRSLAAGARIVVRQGVYQAPPGGITLAQIVANFGLQSVQQLNDANPRWKAKGSLPDPLPFPIAIFLPSMELTAGTSLHTASLADIAAYYGENLTALAADNAGVLGLFANGQSITVSGGPRARHATVPSGVEGVTASRRMPPEVPTNPKEGGYANAFLLNDFSLLNYEVAENVFFRESKMGLPAGPTVPAAGAGGSNDKIRIPKTLAHGDEWEYRQAFPYPKFALSPANKTATLPDPADDPYRGVGSILQVDFTWQDYYGNTLVTTLTSPSASGNGKLNQPPMLTGYVDPLTALSQWPSISSAWHVVAETGAQLAIELTFDATRYNGLIAAKATGVTTIQATFTSALEVASATNPLGYTLVSGDGIIFGIASASLGGDERTVTLVTDAPLSDDTIYVLKISNIRAKQAGTLPPPTFSGTATFYYPDDPPLQSSSLRDNARKDLRIYTNLYYQLNDANGIALSVDTSLLDARVDLRPSQQTALLAWLFTGSATTSIYFFIQNREAGQTDVASPPARSTIAIDLPLASLNASQIYKLTVDFVIRRTGGAVLENLQTTSGIRSASTSIAPYVQNVDPSNLSSDTLGLTAFARDFEAALSVAGSYLMKVASGIDREAVSSVRNGATLWAVRIGVDGTNQPIAYAINNVGKPAVFAPRPISNQLQNRKGIPIYDYTTGTGISTEVSRYLDFVDIDMDIWGQSLFASVDDVLTPEFTSATQIVSAHASQPEMPENYLQQILDQKKLLAAAASLWMVPVFLDENTDPTTAQAAFYQQLLSRLSNAYGTRAAIQFSATVNASIVEPGTTTSPRLFGNIIDNATVGEPRSEITLTSPKLSLETTPEAPLPFLLLAADNVREDGAIVAEIELDLTYDVTAIEHQISDVNGIEGYVASSWLHFIIPGETRPLTQKLGVFQVPMLLRAFPTNPTMVAQSGEPSNPNAPILSDLTEWTYAFVYSLPFHYPQDRVYCEVEFNIAEKLHAEFAFIDAFPALAEFINVYPDVRKDLVGILSKIDATTDDANLIRNARVALESFIDLLNRITSTVSGGALVAKNPPRRLGGSNAETYSFSIQEGSIERADPDDPKKTVNALLVTIVGAPPAGIGTPVVLIDSQIWTPTLYESDGTTFSYYYFDPVANKYLLAQDGQRIADRTVSLPSMDILRRQDAWATVHIKRNEIPGRPTATEFVYTTADVQFAAPLYPTIDSSAPRDIAKIRSSTPQVLSLEEQLKNLFAVLFARLAPDEDTEVTIQVETTYAYRIALALEPIALPILMQAPLKVVVAPSSEASTPPLSTMIANWTAAIETWFDTIAPIGFDGTLNFDLTIMSNLTAQPMPLLRLRELYLRIVDIDPPLKTS
jgi:hypothetical protein